MPPGRTVHLTGFEDVPNDPQRVKCVLCTGQSSEPYTIQRSSRRDHISTRTHTDAKALVPTEEEEDEGPSNAPFVSKPTTLNDIWDNDSDEEMPDAGLAPINPFDDISYHEGHFMDEFGMEIDLHPGLDQELIRDKEETAHLFSQIEDLNLFEHSILDPRTAEVNNFFDPGEDGEDSDGEDFEHPPVVNDDEWSPHGSIPMFMLDMLDNLPRHPISDDLMKTFMWVLRECGCRNVPTFSARRAMQAKATKKVGILPEAHTSALGNNFFMNHPSKLLALVRSFWFSTASLFAHSSQDWSNPFVRKHLHVYPEISTTISETWQAEKMLNGYGIDDYSPMWADWEESPHRHFYVKELAQLRGGKFVLPMRWVVMDGAEHFQGHEVVFYEATNTFVVHDDTMLIVKCSELQRNMVDIQAAQEIKFAAHSPTFISSNLHPVRTIANGRPVFVLRLIPWTDDVSGNVTKQFNPHTNTYVLNGSLPHRLHAQEYFVRFSSTSQHVSSTEQFDGLGTHLNEWTEAYDCQLETEILFKIIPHVLPADNPQQAENCSHVGANGNFYCRRCKVGGTDVHCETNEGYHAFYETGERRTSEETARLLKLQIRTVCLGVQKDVDRIQVENGVKDNIASFWSALAIQMAREKQKSRLSDRDTRDLRLNDHKVTGIARQEIKEEIKEKIQEEVFEWVVQQPPERFEKLALDSSLRKQLRAGDHYNILIGGIHGLEPHDDTSCEILHTYLLGEDKYVWHVTTKTWAKDTGDTFATWLQSLSTQGLTIPTLWSRYIVQYKNTLIGKHFKTLQQTAVFHLHSLREPLVFELWKASGELGALIWYPKIKNLDEYLDDLQTCIDNVLDIWGHIDPTRILTKLKLHILPHLKEDIRHNGPAIIFATEIFECWNAVFRMCSVFSNHLAPSHGITIMLGDMERFKHQVSGGWWKSSDGSWVQAGSKVRQFFAMN